MREPVSNNTIGNLAIVSLDREASVMAQGLLVGVVALVTYLTTLAPGLTSEDAGELVAAAAVLGVPHPPGFPLWVLLAHAAIAISPAAPAWTVNLLSALYAAGTAGTATVLAQRLGASRTASMAAGLLLAFGPTFWSQAIIAEVYSLNTLLLAFALVSVVHWSAAQPEGSDRGLRWAAAFCGLALTNHHPLTLLAAPAFVTYMLLRSRGAVLTVRRLAPVLACLTLPLLLYLYLPLAARQGPPVNWGDPSTLEAMWAHITRQSYRSLELSADVTWHDKWAFLRLFGELWATELTPWVLVLALPVGVFALRHRTAELALLSLVIVCNSAVLLLVLRFAYEHENIMRVNEYFLPSYVASVPLVAVGLDRWTSWVRSPKWRPLAQAGGLALPLTAFVISRPQVDMSDYHLAEDFNRNILETLPKDAIYFPSGDYVSFPTLYMMAVEKKRTDVLLANYTGMPSAELVAFAQDLDPTVDTHDPGALQATLLSSSARPLVFAAKSDVRVPGLTLRPWGLVYRAWRPHEAAQPGPDPRKQPILRHTERGGPVDDLGRSILADYHRALAEAHAQDGRMTTAATAFETAADWCARSKECLNNLGSTAAEHGLHELAIQLYEHAKALSPDYVTPRRNLALLLDRLRRRDEAITAFETLLEVAPDDQSAQRRLAALKRPPSPADQRVLDFEHAVQEEPERAPLWNNLGTAYVEAGRPKDALRAYLEAVRLDPSYAMAHRHLVALYIQYFGDSESAARHRELSKQMQDAQ